MGEAGHWSLVFNAHPSALGPGHGFQTLTDVRVPLALYLLSTSSFTIFDSPTLACATVN